LIRVVSGARPSAYDAYGKKCFLAFDEFWPQDIQMYVYVEEPLRPISPRIHFRSLFDCDGQREFIERHLGDPLSNGRIVDWRMTAKQRSQFRNKQAYEHRYDAVRWSRQMFIPDHAILDCEDGDILVWLDCDVLTFDAIPQGFVEELLAGYDLVSVGKDNLNTDIGFWAIRVNCRTRRFVREMADLFRTDRVFMLGQWRSGYVFDVVAEWFERFCELKHRRLATPGRRHVWFETSLGKYMDHLKGSQRKVAGYSKERFES